MKTTVSHKGLWGRKTIFLSESVFRRLCNLALNEEVGVSGERRTEMMKNNRLDMLKLPMDKVSLYSRWEIKQKESELAVKDGKNFSIVPDDVNKWYKICLESGDKDDILNYQQRAYNLLSFWAKGAEAITNKLENGKITGLIEPNPTDGAKFGDFFGMVCKLYYMPCALESLYCDDFFADLAPKFDKMVSAAIIFCKRMETANTAVSSFAGHNLKLLFPLEWKEFAAKRRGLKDGSIKPQLEVSNFVDDDEPLMTTNDNDFEF